MCCEQKHQCLVQFFFYCTYNDGILEGIVSGLVHFGLVYFLDCERRLLRDSD